MQTLRDALNTQLEDVKAKIMGYVAELEQLMDSIDERYFDPADAPSSVLQIWSEATNVIWDEMEAVEQYSMFDEFQAFLSTAEEELLKLVSRFNHWTRRKVVDTKEAANMINRSRSSVYYWIKTGKLEARKVNGRWFIIA